MDVEKMINVCVIRKKEIKREIKSFEQTDESNNPQWKSIRE